MPKMDLTQKVIARFLKAIVPQNIGFAENGMLLSYSEYSEQFSIKKIISFVYTIKEIRRWGWKCQALAIELEIEELVAKLNKLLTVRFIRQDLIPTSLSIPVPRDKVLQPLAGRAPPNKLFTPIPRIESGGYARSDLPNSAY